MLSYVVICVHTQASTLTHMYLLFAFRRGPKSTLHLDLDFKCRLSMRKPGLFAEMTGSRAVASQADEPVAYCNKKKHRSLKIKREPRWFTFIIPCWGGWFKVEGQPGWCRAQLSSQHFSNKQQYKKNTHEQAQQPTHESSQWVKLKQFKGYDPHT